MYKITLSNGTVLSDLELNGNNYISDTKISDSAFNGGLDTVTIEGGEQVEVLHDAFLVANRTTTDGKSWFIISEKTQEMKDREFAAQLRADIDFIGVMTDTL